MKARSGTAHFHEDREGSQVRNDEFVGAVSGGNRGDDGGSRTRSSDVGADPRWHVEEYVERFGDSLDCRRFKAMVVDGSSSFIYDRRRIKHDTCVGAWKRRQGSFDRKKSMLMTGSPNANMPFFCSQEKVPYCVDCLTKWEELLSESKRVTLTCR